MEHNTGKNILFVIPSLRGGGAERVLVNLLNIFNYKKYNVSLCVVNNEGIYFNEIPQEVEIKVLFQSPSIGRIFNKLYRSIGFCWLYKLLIYKRYNNRQFDVGIAFQDSSYADLLFFFKAPITKKISWVHSSYFTRKTYQKYKNQREKEKLIKRRYSKLDCLVFVSQDSKDSFVRMFGIPTNMEVCYNIIDKDRIIAKSREKFDCTFNHNVVNIIALGNLLEVKGYDKLICALSLLNKDGIEFHLRILGDGIMRKNLQRQINTLKLNEKVSLMGFISNPYPILKESDIFVMTSISEALPTALIEAMIMGVAVAVTDCSGCNEIVGSGKFGLVAEQTVESIYYSLKEMICDKEKRNFYSNKSLIRAEIFNDKSVLAKVYSIIGQL